MMKTQPTTILRRLWEHRLLALILGGLLITPVHAQQVYFGRHEIGLVELQGIELMPIPIDLDQDGAVERIGISEYFTEADAILIPSGRWAVSDGASPPTYTLDPFGPWGSPNNDYVPWGTGHIDNDGQLDVFFGIADWSFGHIDGFAWSRNLGGSPPVLDVKNGLLDLHYCQRVCSFGPFSEPLQDIDADGDDDLVYFSSCGLEWFENVNGQQALCGTEQVIWTGSARGELVDLDADGFIDIVSNDGTWQWNLGQWPLNFGMRTHAGEPLDHVIVCELNGAPGPDILGVTPDGRILAVLNNGQSPPVFSVMHVGIEQIADAEYLPADLNGDGLDDAVWYDSSVFSNGDEGLGWFENDPNGSGSLIARALHADVVASSPGNSGGLGYRLMFADADGDGDDDIFGIEGREYYWYEAGEATNTRTGARYRLVADAISAALTGDRLRVSKGLIEAGPTSTSRAKRSRSRSQPTSCSPRGTPSLWATVQPSK